MIRKITAAYTLALMGLMVVLGSCKKEYESIETTDDAVIQQYIKSNNIDSVKKDTSGFYYQVVSQGDTGVFYKNTDSVFYHVAVKSLANGTVYYTDPVTSNLGTYVGYASQLVTVNIPAIRTAMLALKPGGVARILLPSYLAFGRNGLTNINVPPNEVIDLVITTLPERTQSAVDDRVIREFIASKNITGMVKSPSGVYYSISAPGSGAAVINEGSSVTVKYTGKLIDDTIFDSSTDSTATFTLNKLVKGWIEIIPKLKTGGKVRMLIPSASGYGTAATAGVPANSVLDFDVEVVEVK